MALKDLAAESFFLGLLRRSSRAPAFAIAAVLGVIVIEAVGLDRFKAAKGASDECNVSFTEFLAQRLPKFYDLESALGDRVPSKLLGVIIKRQTAMNEDQRRTYHSWQQGTPDLPKVVETLRRLDEPRTLVASALAAQKQAKIPVFQQETRPKPDAQSYPPAGGVDAEPEEEEEGEEEETAEA